MPNNQAELPIVIVNCPSRPLAMSPVQVANIGTIRAGRACRILPTAAKPGQVADNGRVRMGGACRILPPGLGQA